VVSGGIEAGAAWNSGRTMQGLKLLIAGACREPLKTLYIGQKNGTKKSPASCPIQSGIANSAASRSINSSQHLTEEAGAMQVPA